MTVYALRLENGTDTAPRMRMGDAVAMPAGTSLLRTRQGFRPEPGVAACAAVAGNMKVTVAPFMAWVQGGVSVAQGGYPVVSDATVTLSLADGHASLPRIDVVAVRVRDNSYDGSAAIDAAVVVVQGTPGGGVPLLPTNALAVAHVAVPAGLSAGTGGLASGHITDKRTYLSAGGPIPVLSQSERDAMPGVIGRAVFRMDTNTLEVLTSSGWGTIPVPITPQITKAAAVSVNVDGANRFTITFPAAFPNNCHAITVEQGGTFNAPFGPVGPFMIEALSRTSATVRASVGSLTGLLVRYIAVGD